MTGGSYSADENVNAKEMQRMVLMLNNNHGWGLFDSNPYPNVENGESFGSTMDVFPFVNQLIIWCILTLAAHIVGIKVVQSDSDP